MHLRHSSLLLLAVAIVLSGTCAEHAYALDDNHRISARSRREATELARKEHVNRLRSEKAAMPEDTSASENGEDAAGLPLEIVEEKSDFYTFGAQVNITDLATGDRTYGYSNAGGTLPLIAPGKYTVFTEAARKGYPQEAKYQIVDGETGQVVEEFPRTHVPVTNVWIEAGQKLRVIVLPATRPYNSAFFRLGKQRTPVAIIYNRPYPILDFEPGAFRGTEQFSCAQIAMAFWGMKLAKEQPSVAERIRTKGVDIGRSGSGSRVEDPELVLGVRVIAQDLAKTFVERRSENMEDYRGKFHVSFQVQRTPAGRIPRGLLVMTEEELATELEKELLWIQYHNVHRINEGGGYAGQSFLDDFKEGKEKAMIWPSVSVRATELFRTSVGKLEALAAGAGMDAVITTESGETGVARRLLTQELKELVKAVRRERANDETYPLEWLKEAQEVARMPLYDRMKNLDATEKNALDRLKLLDPKDATIE